MTRVLHGDVTSPIVGRDLLIGITAFLVWYLLCSVAAHAGIVRLPLVQQIPYLRDFWTASASTSEDISFVFLLFLIHFAIFVFIRIFTRSTVVAALAAWFLLTFTVGSGVQPTYDSAVGYFAAMLVIGADTALFFFLAIRFGLLTWVSWAVMLVLLRWPLTADPSIYTFRAGLGIVFAISFLAVLAAIVATGAWPGRSRVLQRRVRHC